MPLPSQRIVGQHASNHTRVALLYYQRGTGPLQRAFVAFGKLASHLCSTYAAPEDYLNFLLQSTVDRRK